MTTTSFDPAAAREGVLSAIAEAARAAGRHPASVTLTAVSKQQPWPRIAALLAAGQKVFGENRVREAQQRWEDRRDGLELRLIGPLQTNKAAVAIGLFDVIETLDRPRLAKALADEMARQGRTPKLFIQVNTGEEPQKSGVIPTETDAFVATCRREFGLQPVGLMCIPPLGEPAAPHFALLAKIGRRNGLAELSMGMSADFAVAVRFGATAVRVGEALFGPRPAHA
jgi:pyridoxal phosphate enzyme (YggS family)